MKEKKTIDLLHGSTKKLYLRYLLPTIFGAMVTSIYIIADTIMIGWGVGKEGIAALNVVLPLFNVYFGIGTLFGVGGGVLTAIAFGEGDEKKGQRFFTLSLVSLCVMGVLSWIVFGFGFEKIMRLWGGTDHLMPLIRSYAIPFVIAAPIIMMSTLLQSFVRNDKDPDRVMKGVIAGGCTNVVLDYIFIFIFHMGIFGASIATVIGNSLTVFILATHFLSKHNHLKLVKGFFSLKRLKRITGNGLASFVVELSNGLVICLFNIQLGRYVGELGIAVYGIVSNSAIVAMSLANGVALAAQPIIAGNYGAGNYKRIRSVAKTALVASVAVGIGMTLLGEVFPQLVATTFVKLTPDMKEMAIPAVRIYFLSFLFMAINILLSNYFQATLAPEKSLTISLLRGMVFSGIFVVVFPMYFGVKGIWMVMPIGEMLTLGIALILLHKTEKNKEEIL